MVDTGIVMPLYKQDIGYLQAAISSVLAQSYRAFRFIIVIDGAPEMIEPALHAAMGDPRVQLVTLPQNQGVSHALNRGFDELFKDPAIKYVTWVSSDNVYHSSFIERLRCELEQGPDSLGLVYSTFRQIDAAGNSLYDEQHQQALIRYQSQPHHELLNASIVGVSFMYKSQYARLIDGYRLQPVEDYDYWLRLTETCSMKFIPEILMDYRVDSAFSVSASLRSQKEHRRWRHAFQIAKHEARARRGIPLEMTILMPITDMSQAEPLLDNLLEQHYSNCIVRLLDITPEQGASSLLEMMLDPRLIVTPRPHYSVKEALIQAIGETTTRFVVCFGVKPYIAVTDLLYLTDLLRPLQDTHAFSYYTDDHSTIGSGRGVQSVPPEWNYVYYTHRLHQTLEQGGAFS
ncbi:glycosyltransferase family 2 protein [Paenibacillus jamilae]|uniref:glycosyltransferase family 2 protein n=1 Tax=Paenibacillus TaxID=44249 RepID=UPI000E3CA07F|nr:glycosyltransferase family 2 protein [Paenibacillus jamilae]RFT98272.1 glycosyltransferase family 2 protein [Paenibacillus jamilae]